MSIVTHLCKRSSLDLIRCSSALSTTSDSQPAKIKLSGNKYAPSQNHISLSFEDFIKIKKSIKRNGRISAFVSYVVAPFGVNSILSQMFPLWFIENPAPVEIFEMPLDPGFLVIGASVIGGLSTAILTLSLYPKIFFMINSEIKEPYIQREKDLKRRLNYYRCTEAIEVGYSDDYYGDKIHTLSDYRYWIRIQQIKWQNYKQSLKTPASSTSDDATAPV